MLDAGFEPGSCGFLFLLLKVASDIQLMSGFFTADSCTEAGGHVEEVQGPDQVTLKHK